MSPYRLRGPTCLSFSGGRTSAFMLHQVLQANADQLHLLIVCFANTGREHPATLDFVLEVGRRWGVAIVWLEYRGGRPGWEVVDYVTADRHGHPYAELIRAKKYLPNPITRFCTSELKIRPMHRYIRDLVGWTSYDMLLGIRADEPRRVSKMRGKATSESKGALIGLPLVDAGVTVDDVGAFWRVQSFDLRLRAINGRALLGNCDGCFLKGAAQVYSIIASDRSVGRWWAEQEAWVEEHGKPGKNGARFRIDRPTYRQMLDYADDQVDAFSIEDEPEAIVDCFCGAGD